MKKKNTTDTTNVVITPYQYVTTYIINANDEALSSMENCFNSWTTLAPRKSYTALIILGKIAIYNKKNVKILIADYKNSFKQFHGLPNFYGYENAIKGIEIFNEELKRRIADNGNQMNLTLYGIYLLMN